MANSKTSLSGIKGVQKVSEREATISPEQLQLFEVKQKTQSGPNMMGMNNGENNKADLSSQ